MIDLIQDMITQRTAVKRLQWRVCEFFFQPLTTDLNVFPKRVEYYEKYEKCVVKTNI